MEPTPRKPNMTRAYPTYPHTALRASAAVWLCLACLALLSHTAATTSSSPSLVRLRLSVVPPDSVAATASSSQDASEAAASSRLIVTGGLVLVNMTAFSPVTKHGIVELPFPIHPAFPTRHRLSLNHPAYVYPDLLVSIAAASASGSAAPPVQVAWSPLDRSNKYKGKPVDTAVVVDDAAYVARATWTALGPRKYFEERPGFNPFAMLKSPMMFMPLLSLGLLFLLPKLSAMLDEAKAEVGGGEKKDEQSVLAKHFKSL